MKLYLYPPGTAPLPHVPLTELVKFRGAIWPKLGIPFVPWGPRPMQDDNVACVDYPEAFDRPTLDRIMAAYKGMGFTHTPMGPIVDVGYHGQLPSCDFRHNFGAYLDLAEYLERRWNLRVCHFLRPDRGCVGLGWELPEVEEILTPLFSSPRAQALMRIVVLGWEPGPQYFYNNDWWIGMLGWMARVFPKALRGIHMVSDTDAPVGQDDDRRGISNGQGWANVARFLHFWLVQNSGWTGGSDSIPSDEFITNFTNQFNPKVRGSFPDRFRPGNSYGWPGFSAWGDDQGIIALPGEYAAFGLYWQNFPMEQARRLGQLALNAGALGAFDGC